MAINFGCRGEPRPDFCQIIDENSHCFKTEESKEEYEKPIKEMVGFICVSPDDFAELKIHHQDLHEDLKSNGN